MIAFASGVPKPNSLRQRWPINNIPRLRAYLNCTFFSTAVRRSRLGVSRDGRVTLYLVRMGIHFSYGSDIAKPLEPPMTVLHFLYLALIPRVTSSGGGRKRAARRGGHTAAAALDYIKCPHKSGISLLLRFVFANVTNSLFAFPLCVCVCVSSAFSHALTA